MSIAPHALPYRNDNKLLEDRLVDTMIYDGLIDAFNNWVNVSIFEVKKRYEL